MELKNTLQTILNQPTESFGNMQYAQVYAKAAMELGDSQNAWLETDGIATMVRHEVTGKMMTGRELKAQLLYVLCNLDGWRGELAKETKKIIKKYSK